MTHPRMKIRLPIREGIALILDEHGAEIEFDNGRITATWPLSTDALLTLRDGCDAAFKIWQARPRTSP